MGFFGNNQQVYEGQYGGFDPNSLPGASVVNAHMTPQQAAGIFNTWQMQGNANAQGGANAPNQSLGLGDLYNAALFRDIGGTGGMTQGQVANQMGTLNAGINAQGQQARTQMEAALGQRGMLNSGLLERGVANVGQAKGNAMAQGAASILQAQAQTQQAAQQQGMQMYMQAVQSRFSAEMQARQLGLSEAQIQNSLDQADFQAAAGLAGSLGSLFAGPVGGMVGGAIGSAAGSLFGGGDSGATPTGGYFGGDTALQITPASYLGG
jgi:hypothetical protein